MAFAAFGAAIKKKPDRYNKVRSDKGAVCLESTLDSVVDAYAGIKPGTPRAEIEGHIRKVVADAQYYTQQQSQAIQRGAGPESDSWDGNSTTLVDLATIIFQKRSISEGETRKDEARWAFREFHHHFPNAAIQLLPLFTEKGYGYWQDLNQIWRDICDEFTRENVGANAADTEQFYAHYNPLISEIVRLFMTQRARDLQTLSDGGSPGMCGKWILSENSAGNKPRKADMRSAKRTAAALAKKADEASGGEVPTRSYKMRTKPRDTPIFWFYRQSGSGALVRQSYVNTMIRSILREKSSAPWTRKEIPFRAKKDYRKGNTRLRSAIQIVEQKLCRKDPTDIDPSKLTAINLNRYSKYLYNEVAVPPGCDPVKLKSTQQTTGNREPDNLERVALRQRTKDFFAGPKAVEKLAAKTGALTPIDIYINRKNHGRSGAEHAQDEVMWEAMRRDTRDKILEYCAAEGVRPRKVIPLVDMSGSMSQALPGATQPTRRSTQSPKQVADAAMSLGIMMATAKPDDDPLYGAMLSFSSQPVWFNLPRGAPLSDMIRSVDTNTRGDRLSTDFYKAYMEVIKTVARLVRAGKMTADQVTEVVLVALSDLQFDNPSCPGFDGYWDSLTPSAAMHGYYGRRVRSSATETTYQRLEREAVRHGLPGLPTMIFWNLSTRPKGIQAESSKKGVEFLSGYSQNNIRHTFYGPTDAPEEEVVDGVAVKVAQTTPRDKMLKILYQPFFDPVRAVFTAMTHGPFSLYKFERPEPEDDAADADDAPVPAPAPAHAASVPAPVPAHGATDGATILTLLASESVVGGAVATVATAPDEDGLFSREPELAPRGWYGSDKGRDFAMAVSSAGGVVEVSGW